MKNIRPRKFRRRQIPVLVVLLALLACCIIFVWATRDAMTGLSFLPGRGPTAASLGARKTIVDLSPWQTAQTLAALAVSAEEVQYAREAEHLADHEVDQAFAAALRQATIQAQHRNLSGEALALAQNVDRLQQVVNQDQAAVKQPPPPAGAKPSDSVGTDTEIANAQLKLDSDELSDAQEDLARASGDQRAEIQGELDAHEAAMKKYDSESHLNGQIAVLSISRYSTLVGRIGAWGRQRTRRGLLQQAIDQTQNDIRAITDQHNALEAQLNASTSAAADAGDRNARLAAIKDRTANRQLLTIYDDRIQTMQQLVTVYTRWSAQLARQHRILRHLILLSCAWILFILVCMVLADAAVRRIMSSPKLDRRQAQTLRMVLVVVVQTIGVLLILIVLFGVPHETPTILGLTTAALTFALQDFILAFLGWFVLMGKRGIRVGDWVEINGVSGEVTEVGLMRTTLLETGNLAGGGTPTGRRITFMNGFAIRGLYFNFSTSGQWMWDEISVTVPSVVDTHATLDRILNAVQEETQENARLADQEWKRGAHSQSLAAFHTDPALNIRPSGSGVDVAVRYVTRASERFEMRNRLYRRLLNVLHEPAAEAEPQPTS